jgi:hypothetical protein
MEEEKASSIDRTNGFLDAVGIIVVVVVIVIIIITTTITTTIIIIIIVVVVVIIDTVANYGPWPSGQRNARFCCSQLQIPNSFPQ